MRKHFLRMMLVSNISGLCLCGATLLWVLFSGFSGWWRIASNPLTHLLYISVALYCLRSAERSIKWLAITGILRAIAAGWQFVHSLRYFVSIGIHNISDFLQFPVAMVFLVALGLYWQSKKEM